MTCIVGIQTGNKAVICGDSFGGSDYIKHVIAKPKVFEANGIVMGYTSSFRMGQLLEYATNFDVSKIKDVDRFIHTEFIDHIREIFKDNGYSKVESNVEEGGSFLVAINGELYEIQEDYAVLKNADGIHAIGAGYQYALGAMHATQKEDNKIVEGLRAAAYYSPFVCEPFTMLSSYRNGGANG